MYKGEMKGEVKGDKLLFYGVDLNPVINDQVYDIVEESDEDGRIMYERSEANIVKKIIYLKGLGFEFEEIKEEKSLRGPPEKPTEDPDADPEEDLDADEDDDKKKKEKKAMQSDNPLILKEGERPSGYERLEVAMRFVNREHEDSIKKILAGEIGKDQINEVKGINELVDKLKALLALGIDELKKIVREVIKNNYMEGWDEAEQDLNINITPDPNAIDYMAEYTYDNIKGMNDDIAQNLRQVMQRGFMDGSSLEEMKAEITKVFDVGNNRVTMIARTESNRAANFGRLHGYMKAGQPGKKVYSAHLDGRTSPLCKRLDGQEAELNEDFVDPKGEWKGPVPPAHVNCRSSWTFKSEDEDGT